jgi:hypothetical protein
MDRLGNTLSSESFFTESPLDVVQDFSMSGITFIQHILELQVSGTETVAEMLSKDPTTVLSNINHRPVDGE